MFCRKCGKKLEDGEVVCSHCGEQRSDIPRPMPAVNDSSSNVSSKKVIGVIAVATILIVAAIGAVMFFVPFSDDYRVTITFDKVALYSETGSVQTPMIYDAETESFYYYYDDGTGLKKHKDPITSVVSYFSCEYGDNQRTTHDIRLDINKGTEHNDANYVDYGRFVSFDITSSKDVEFITMFMIMEDTGSGSYVDIFTEEGNTGISGISLGINLNKKSEQIVIMGESELFAVVSLTVTVDKL